MFNLVQSLMGAGAPPTCFHCGEVGHMARECPKKNEPGISPRPSFKGGNKRAPGRDARAPGRDPKSPAKSWRFTAPGTGESSTKTHQGKQFRWCAKCKRWSTTHDTATHTGAKGKSPTPAPQANLCLVPDVPDPSAWLFMFEFPHLSDILRLLLKPFLTYLLPLLAVGFLVFGFLFRPHTKPRWLRRAELKAYRRATKPRRRFIRVFRKPPTLPLQKRTREAESFHADVLNILRGIASNRPAHHGRPSPVTGRRPDPSHYGRTSSPGPGHHPALSHYGRKLPGPGHHPAPSHY
jgi:hypothetical protein